MIKALHHPAPSSAWQSAGWLVLGAAYLLFTSTLQAATPAPRVSIILDDLGGHWQSGQRALKLPGPITYAFLPQTPHAATMARQAYADKKEVMIHMPMQAMTGNRLGPGGLTLDMTRAAFMQTLRDNLASVPHAKGVNNHMGSLLTRHPGHMQWLMTGLREYAPDFYFVDSRTTHHTVANQLAEENHIPTRQRDIFLDDDPSPKAIKRQLQRLLQQAKLNGQAIGIGHPYATTLDALEKWLPTLEQHGVELIPVSALFKPAAAPTPRQAGTANDGPLVYVSPTPEGQQSAISATTATKTSLNPL